MTRKKSADMTQILMVCGVGMITLFAVLILWGIVDSFLSADITVTKPTIKNVIKSDSNDAYDVTFSVKNEKNKDVKAFLKTEIGFNAYKMRNANTMSQKPNFYRFFQVMKESRDEFIVPTGADQEVQVTVVVEKNTYGKFEIKPETEIYPRVTTEKVSWIDESAKPQV